MKVGEAGHAGRTVRFAVRTVLVIGLLLLGIRAGNAIGGFTSGRVAGNGVPDIARNRAWASAGVRAPSAGVSIVVDPDIEPLRPGRLGQLVETEGFHTFRHRCSSCHDPPDPAMHEPGEWRGIVRRMGDWMRAARVMPMLPADTAAIGAFLEQAAAAR